MKVAIPSEMKMLDKKAIEQFEIPSVVLMENAALAVAKVCLKRLKKLKKNSVLIVAGKGNNAGDGFAVARILYNKGIYVEVVLAEPIEKIQSDALIQLKIIENMGIGIHTIENFSKKLKEFSFIIDALLGTGLEGEVREPICNVIDTINQSEKYIISIDIPSGISGKNGKILKIAVKANETVTFALPKLGLLLYPAVEYVGKLHIADISIPKKAVEEMHINQNMLTKKEAVQLLPKRIPRSNKGTYGKLFIIAGSRNMTGAAVLACRSAYKIGAGLVYSCIPKKIMKVVQALVPAAVEVPLEEEYGKVCSYAFDDLEEKLKKATAVVLGCGLGTGEEVTEFVIQVLENITCPIVLDADGLNAITKNIEIFDKMKITPIVTPHIGEMSRLIGKTTTEILDDIVSTAKEFAQKYHVIIVLKDAHTIIASPEGQIFINTTGNEAMAKGGFGDVLSGIIGGLLAQGCEPFDAAVLGVYIHGLSGDIAAKKFGKYSLLPEELANTISDTIQYLEKSNISK